MNGTIYPQNLTKLPQQAASKKARNFADIQ